MAEDWRERPRREARERHREVRAVLAEAGSAPALRTALEAIARRPQFAALTWLWGPVLYERDRVLFRPFILAHFDTAALDARGEPLAVWTGPTAPALERWLEHADAADDIQVTRRLYAWQLATLPVRDRELAWRADLRQRFTAAATPAQRLTAVAKLEGLHWVDGATALALYEVDATTARPVIVAHLPASWWFAGKLRIDWAPLLERTRERDSELHFTLYRRMIDARPWSVDILKLAATPLTAAALDAELERRHPEIRPDTAAETFVTLARMRGRDVVPYILRHVASMMPRWVFLRPEARGLAELLALAESAGWLDLWAAVLQTSATPMLFDRTVRELVASTAVTADEAMQRLHAIAGPGREWNAGSVGVTAVHRLEPDTALALYARYPALVRSRFRMHLTGVYPALVAAAIAAGDDDLIDFFASRMAMQQPAYGMTKSWGEAVATLTAHYEALPAATFVARAAAALSAMPAGAIWGYDELLRRNPLARLFFERSTTMYLADPAAVRDLLESPQIHVQLLGLRALAQGDPRAPAVAAAAHDLVQATLFRPLHRRTRLVAFRALAAAARHDEATARYLLGRMREALSLPPQRYPQEELVGVIAGVLQRWPALRGPTEQLQIFGLAPAHATDAAPA